MNNYIENNLQQDEHLKVKAEINKIAFITPFLAAIFSHVMLFYIIDSNSSNSFGIIAILPLVFILIRSYLEIIKVITYIFCSVLAFTDKRVISKKGFLNTKTLDSPIDKINDIHIRQSLFGKIFNYSKVIIMTSSSIYDFNYVKNAQELKNLLVTHEEVQKVEIQETTTNNNPSLSKYDELCKLKELLDKNVITQEEFDKKKKEFLDL